MPTMSQPMSGRLLAMKKAHADWAATMLPYPEDSTSWDIHGQVPDRY